MTAIVRPQPTVARLPQGLALRPIVFALTAAASVEVLLLRVFTRVAIHIPAFPFLQGPEEVLSFAGRYAYYLAAVLVIAALAALTAAFAAGARPETMNVSSIGAGAVTGFAISAALLRAQVGDEQTMQLAILATVASLALAAAISRKRLAVPATLFAAAFVLNAIPNIAQADAVFTISAGAERLFRSVAEACFITFAISTLLLVRGPVRRREWVLGSTVCALVASLFATGGSATLGILLLWNEGISAWMPGVTYAAAAGALTVSLLAQRRQGNALTAAAVVLLIAGGSGFHSTYQTALVITGLALIALQARPRSSVRG